MDYIGEKLGDIGSAIKDTPGPLAFFLLMLFAFFLFMVLPRFMGADVEATCYVSGVVVFSGHADKIKQTVDDWEIINQFPGGEYRYVIDGQCVIGPIVEMKEVDENTSH